MPKFEVSVPVTIWVMHEIEAKDEDAAMEISYEKDFALERLAGIRSMIAPADDHASSSFGEPDFDKLTIDQLSEG